MKKANREATIGIPEDYAEELAPCSFRGGGPRPVQAGWATQENTAATRERTATLVYYEIANTAARRERTARQG